MKNFNKLIMFGFGMALMGCDIFEVRTEKVDPKPMNKYELYQRDCMINDKFIDPISKARLIILNNNMAIPLTDSAYKATPSRVVFQPCVDYLVKTRGL